MLTLLFLGGGKTLQFTTDQERRGVSAEFRRKGGGTERPPLFRQAPSVEHRTPID